eukprot:CAMPEP_0115347954 /NCGR_PEP_ID=MMETSP0270-20121206/95162_1 /TAXON_ID=71861 /ORGANISM="Scrippsiella trochoidea, Strain CCMP3099" /LENGTH=229 /DNA_ID=CAMNT_0002769923 /DNA_START=247 /DNA_END=936 /DNA_ORIENTATION=+
MPASWGEVALIAAVRVFQRAGAAAHSNDDSQSVWTCHFVRPVTGGASARCDDRLAVVTLSMGGPRLELCELNEPCRLSSVVPHVKHGGALHKQPNHASTTYVSIDMSARSIVALHPLVWQNALPLLPPAISAGNALPDHCEAVRARHHIAVSRSALHSNVDVLLVRIRSHGPRDAALDPMYRIGHSIPGAAPTMVFISVPGSAQLCDKLSIRAQRFGILLYLIPPWAQD